MKTLKQFINESARPSEKFGTINLTLDGNFSPRMLDVLKDIAKSLSSRNARLVKEIGLVDFDNDDAFDSPYASQNGGAFDVTRYGIKLELENTLDGLNDGPAFIKRVFPEVCKGVKNPDKAFGRNDEDRALIIYGQATDMICVSFNDYFDGVEDDKDVVKRAKTDKSLARDAEWAQDKTVDAVIFAVHDRAALNAL